MGDTRHDSDNLCSPKTSHAYSFKSCSLFIFILFLFVVSIVILVTSIVIFIVKAQKPDFSVETLRVVSFDLNTLSNSTLFVSSVVSLILNAQNPNKFGIKISPARLHFYMDELPVGVIRVPGFNQPAHSKNINVPTRVLIHCMNVNQVMSGDLSEDDSMKNVVKVKLVGDIGVKLQLFHITMPKIKVLLECYSNIDNKQLVFISEIHTARAARIHNTSLPINSKSLFNKCDTAVYI